MAAEDISARESATLAIVVFIFIRVPAVRTRQNQAVHFAINYDRLGAK
jgi:hypothetical protein